VAKKKNSAERETRDRSLKAERPLIDFLSNAGHGVAPEVELDLRRGRPDDAAHEGEFLSRNNAEEFDHR
jgi:hypothetical protein